MKSEIKGLKEVESIEKNLGVVFVLLTYESDDFAGPENLGIIRIEREKFVSRSKEFNKKLEKIVNGYIKSSQCDDDEWVKIPEGGYADDIAVAYRSRKYGELLIRYSILSVY